MKTSYQIARVWGIPVKLHISLVIPLLYSYFALRSQQGMDVPHAFLFTLLLGILVFGSIALHELGHSFIALRKRCRVRGITLMFIGGVASMERIPTRPMDEFLMAVAGPVVSLMIGVVAAAAGLGFLKLGLALPVQIAWGLAIWNVFLAAFNLVPAFPMDGGRLLRALLSGRVGRLKATYIATRVGRLLAIALGIAAFTGIPGLLAGGNLPLLAIAFFVYLAAGREYQVVRMQEMLAAAGRRAPLPDFEPGPSDDADVVTIGPPPYEKRRRHRQETQSLRRDDDEDGRAR